LVFAFLIVISKKNIWKQLINDIRHQIQFAFLIIILTKIIFGINCSTTSDIKSNMLCCSKVPSSYAPLETTIDGEFNTSGSNREYPGNTRCMSSNTTGRHLVQTGGNALMAYDPETMKDLVNVTLPEGCHPGQVIHIQDPSCRTERVAQIIVPPGSKAGTTIMVKLPEEQYFTPNNQTFGSSSGSVFMNDLTLQEQEEVVMSTSATQTHNRVVVQSQDIPPFPISSHQFNQTNEKEFSMLIRVPVGVAPGTIIHVKIPDDDKFVPVTVPGGGVSQFYANYTLADTIDMNGNKNHDNPIVYGLPMLVLPGIS